MPYDDKKNKNDTYSVYNKDTGKKEGTTHQKGKEALRKYFAALYANSKGK
jgi:hypothetical protein